MLTQVLELSPVLADEPASANTGARNAKDFNTEKSEPGTSIKQQSDASDLKRTLFETDRKVLLECIKVARFNINFQQTANKHWPWRSVLYPLAQSGGSAASFSNSIIDLRQRINGFYDPNLKSKKALKRGEVTSLIGSCLGGGSSAAELAQNFLVDVISRRKGYSPRSRISFVKDSISKIDRLLSERTKLVGASDISDTQLRICLVEGDLLRHIRDQVLIQFKKFSTSSQESMAKENMSFAIDSIQNFAQVSSSVVSLRAFQQPTLDGAASIISLSAGSLAALNPTLSWITGVTARRLHRQQLAQAFPAASRVAEDIPKELAEIKELVGEDPDTIDIRELAFLEEQSSKLDDVVAKEIRTIQKLRRVAAQQAISGPLIATTSVAKSILSTIGFYEYRDDPVTRNRIGLAGRISTLSGQSYSLVKTTTTQIHSFINRRRLERQGKLPEQIAKEQLETLDKLEAQIMAAKL